MSRGTALVTTVTLWTSAGEAVRNAVREALTLWEAFHLPLQTALHSNI